MFCQTTAPPRKPPSFNDTYAAELQRLQQAKDWTHLEQVARQALSAMETQFGADSASVGAAAGWLANALIPQRRYAEAEPFARRSLAVIEKALGADNLACNTASPDAPVAEGLSGLSRGFFYAGAKSLLVSHWRVRDDVAPLLIPAMLLAGREHPDLTRAQALREASLAILDNRELRAADPAAWAPFTLIGEAGP